jgi:chromosome segregation ATPase
MRKLFWSLLIIGAGFFLLKKTSVFSYASLLWTQAKNHVHKQVPTRFEIERARHEIAQLDGDIQGMIRPIAEYKAAIARLKKDIQSAQARLDEQKSILLTMTKDLEGNPTMVMYDGDAYPADRVRVKLQRDFDSFKRLEANLHSQRKLLEAKEISLKATQEQLAKVMAKKREYEVRLAQLEADEETLQIARIGTSVQIDDSRATQIEAALTEIERRQDVHRAEIELRSGTFANDPIPVGRPAHKTTDPVAIRQYLEKGGDVDAAHK